MDLEKISQLSDEQLVGLYRNPKTPKELKKEIIKEINLRDIENLKVEHTSNNNSQLTKKEKLLLIFLPFLLNRHIKILNKNWSHYKNRQFWNFVTVGVLVYILALFLILSINRYL